MPDYVYRGESARMYPYPPIARELTPGELVELAEDEVPTDGRFVPADPAPTADPVPAPADTSTAEAKAPRGAAKTAKE